MKIEHIAMWVSDLESTKEFFVKYFGAISDSGYHNSKTDFRSYFLTFSDGARLEIMTIPQIDDAEKTLFRTGYAHIAFSVGSTERVDELTRELKNAGYRIQSEPRRTGDGYYESCIADLEGNLIEITI